MLTALADLGRVLVGVQPALELLGSALLVWRRVPFALLLAPAGNRLGVIG